MLSGDTCTIGPHMTEEEVSFDGKETLVKDDLHRRIPFHRSRREMAFSWDMVMPR